MTWTRPEIDAWQAHTHRNLRQVTAAVLDLIDVGPSADEDTAVMSRAAVTGRRPTRREQDVTWRQGDTGDTDTRFHYAPTMEGRRAEFYMRPDVRTVAWEAQVQQAVTGLFAALSAAVETVELLRVRPCDEQGRPLPAPAEPPTRLVESGPRAGEQVVDLDPAGCRRHVLAATVWLGAAVDAVADRLYATTGSEVGEYVAGQARQLGTAVRSLAGRYGRERQVEHPETVRCGVCGGLAKYRRLERCDTCRRRELRAS